jgi:transposase
MHSPVLSVGIDVGKKKLDVACLRQDRSVAHDVFNNDKKGVRKIVGFLKQQGTALTVPCTLESTGSYHYPVSLSLRSAGYRVNCVNPIITKKYRKATIRDAKSDKIDAQRIAEIGFLEPNLQEFNLSTDQISAKTLLTSISHVEGILQQLKAHIRYLEELKETINVVMPHRELDRSVAALEAYLERVQAEVCRLAPPEALALSKVIPGVSHRQIATLLVGLGTSASRRASNWWLSSAWIAACDRAGRGKANSVSPNEGMLTSEKRCSSSAGRS